MDTILTQKSSGQWKEEEKALEIFINMSQASKLIFTVEAWLIFINMSQASIAYFYSGGVAHIYKYEPGL